MKKFNDGRIGFNSTFEHRLIERLRSALKAKKYVVKTLFNNKQNTVIFSATKDGIRKIIYGQLRTIETNYVSMNRKFYDKENIEQNPNVFIVLVDRRHLYPMKYKQFITIRNVGFIPGNEPFALIPEEDFKLL